MSTAQNIAAVSKWVDNAPVNVNRDPEALMWHRVAKVAEEAGEVIDEMIKHSGGNPRKPRVESVYALVKELLDTAVAALGAVEHLTGNKGVCMEMLARHAQFVAHRAGVPYS